MTTNVRLRVGVYGGAFDPPHNTHRALAQAALRQLALDRLHIVPTGHAWHKTQQLSAASHRLAMARLAFADLPNTLVDARETQREGPTYTIDTLTALQRDYPHAQLYLVIGGDQARALASWHAIDAVRKAAIICVAQRPDADESQAQAERIFPDLTLLQMPASPLSATEIRGLAAARRDVSHLVPAPVARYIEHHHLYRTDR